VNLNPGAPPCPHCGHPQLADVTDTPGWRYCPACGVIQPDDDDDPHPEAERAAAEPHSRVW
jgi:uncharacterized Zn finger protein (UPF0148 family)